MTPRPSRRAATRRTMCGTSNRASKLPVALGLMVLALGGACRSTGTGESSAPSPTVAVGTPPTSALATSTTASTTTTSSTTTTTVPEPASGFPVDGLLTFRGNPSRAYYGRGPVPSDPVVRWRFPDEPMCSETRVGNAEPTEWCGTGWTGQPAVVARDAGDQVVFGAYDGAVHFLDGVTGERFLPDLQTGDLVKGSVTVDPDGYPLVYIGSRDNLFRVVATDRAEPTVLWSLPADAVSPRLWNDDWDGSALVVDGHLLVGGENSQFHVVRLRRAYGPDGLVTVDPELVFNTPGWDDDLLAALPDRNFSIEGSVALHDGVAYFANSGGLVQGWDVSGVADGRTPTRTFRFWMGDDVDATVVVDSEGMLYVAAEWERATERAAAVGQIVKLDPSRADPLLWSVPDRPPPLAEGEEPAEGSSRPRIAGVWATPAIHRDLLIVPTNGGRLLGIDRASGDIRWEKSLPGPTWQSPVVVDDVLLQGDCHGLLHAYDVSDTTVDPPELWRIPLGGCIESTPAVWDGQIYVGTRGGFFYAVGDR